MKGSKPYPSVVLPKSGGYWLEGDNAGCSLDSPVSPMMPQSASSNACHNIMESDETAKAYRQHFLGKVCVVSVTVPQPYSKKGCTPV